MTGALFESVYRPLGRKSVLWIPVVFGCLFLLCGTVETGLLSWQSTATIHTIMESAATVLALVGGSIAVVRYSARPDRAYMFVGLGLLGSGFLDIFHTVVTSEYFAPMMPSSLQALTPWSWLASRTYLAVFLLFGALETRISLPGFGKNFLDSGLVLLVAVLGMVTYLAFFVSVNLPPAYNGGSLFPRVFEFIPGSLSLLTVALIFTDKNWLKSRFGLLLLLSALVAAVSHIAFMSRSYQLFDTAFDMAHLLKVLEYVLILAGLLWSMHAIYLREQKAVSVVDQQNRTFGLISRIAQAANTADGLHSASLDVTRALVNYTSAHLGQVYFCRGNDLDHLVPTRLVTGQQSEMAALKDLGALKQHLKDDAALMKGAPSLKDLMAGMPVSWRHEEALHGWELGEAAWREGYVVLHACPVRCRGRIVAIVILFHKDLNISYEDQIPYVLRQTSLQLGYTFERHTASQEVLTAKDLAVKANSAKSAFLATMSHELRTPLNAIIGFAEVLRSLSAKKAVSKEQVDEYTGYVLNSGRELLHVVDALLNISYLDRDMTALKHDRIPIQVVLDRWRHMMNEDLAKVRLEFETDVDSSVNGLVADRDILNEIVCQMVRCSVRLGDTDKPVKFSIYPDGNCVSLSLTRAVDDMPQSFFDHCNTISETEFPQGYQADRGLSLSVFIIRALAHLNSGDFTVERRDASRLALVTRLPANDAAIA